MSGLGSLAAVATAALGVVTLRTAWRRRGGAGWILAGWLLLVAATIAWAASGPAPDKAVALAVLAPCLLAPMLITRYAEWPRVGPGPARARSGAVEPPEMGGRLWRTLVRVILAGPLGLAAGVGLAAWAALHLPAPDALRIMTAGLILPTIWAGALVWATTDDALGRVAAGLGVLAVVGFAGAWL